MRSCDDIDEQALSYAEIKALCAGDPRIREKMDLDVQVAKLKVLRGDFQNQKYRLEDKLLKTFPEEIQKQKTRIAALQQDSQIAATHPQDKENFCGMTIKGMVYDDKKAAGERLLLARQEMPNADMMLLGTYRGFELNIRFDSFKNEHQAVLRAELSYPVSLGDDVRGNITRLDNAIDNFADRIANAENALQNLEHTCIHYDHRNRTGHCKCKYDDHPGCRPVRTVPVIPVAWPGRKIKPYGICIPFVPQR